MKGILALLLISSALAQDYSIVRYEAPDYRTFTQEEMSALLGANSSLLPKLKCNGKDEHDVFATAHRSNAGGDSLKISIPKSNIKLTYREGRLYDEVGRPAYAEAPFVMRALTALKRFEKLDSGPKILRQLERSYFPLIIKQGQNAFNPKIEGQGFWSGMKMARAITFLETKRMAPEGNPFYDIGSGGDILWNPNAKDEVIEEDGVKRPIDPDIALAHELYHAFDSIRGMLGMGKVQGRGLELLSVMEHRGVYFENMVREELGLKLRKYYDEAPTRLEGDLLDEQGRPVYIVAPCLTN